MLVKTPDSVAEAHETIRILKADLKSAKGNLVALLKPIILEILLYGSRHQALTPGVIQTLAVKHTWRLHEYRYEIQEVLAQLLSEGLIRGRGDERRGMRYVHADYSDALL